MSALRPGASLRDSRYLFVVFDVLGIAGIMVGRSDMGIVNDRKRVLIRPVMEVCDVSVSDSVKRGGQEDGSWTVFDL